MFYRIIGGAVALASALLKLKDDKGIENSRIKKLQNKIEEYQSVSIFTCNSISRTSQSVIHSFAHSLFTHSS